MDLAGLEANIRKISARRGSVLVRGANAGGDYRHGGIMSSTSVKVEPIETKKDERGETKQVGAEISLSTRLMQTEAATAFPLMQELTSGRVDIVLTPRSVSEDVLTSTQAESLGEIKFPNRHLKIGARLRFDGSESYLPASIGFRTSMTTIDTFTL